MLMWEGDKFREITDEEAARYLFMADEPQPKRVTFQDFMKGNPMSEAEKAKAEAPPAAAVEEKKEPAPTPAKAEFEELLSRPLDIGDPLAPILSPKLFAQLQRAAALYSASKFVPETFQNDVASCFIAIELAVRWKLSPVLVMQHLYLVYGKPGLDGQLAIALINSQGPFRGRIQWRFEGEGKTRKVTAYGYLRDTGELCEATVDWNMVEAEGWNRDKPLRDGKGVQKSKWNTMADHIFKFRSAAFLGRTYCPEVLMGIHTIDEVEDITTSSAGIGNQAIGPAADPLAPGRHERPRKEKSGIRPEDLGPPEGRSEKPMEKHSNCGEFRCLETGTGPVKVPAPAEQPSMFSPGALLEDLRFRLSEGGTLKGDRLQARMDVVAAILKKPKGSLTFEGLDRAEVGIINAALEVAVEKGWGM